MQMLLVVFLSSLSNMQVDPELPLLIIRSVYNRMHHVNLLVALVYFLNKLQKLCPSIKRGVKEFYVQVIDELQGKTEKANKSGKY